ncbi:MAG: hypothetical protein GX585_00840 [Clostridiales bacterium]|nr:hypothetical protein [Clostridiales bacterium]
MARCKRQSNRCAQTAAACCCNQEAEVEGAFVEDMPMCRHVNPIFGSNNTCGCGGCGGCGCCRCGCWNRCGCGCGAGCGWSRCGCGAYNLCGSADLELDPCDFYGQYGAAEGCQAAEDTNFCPGSEADSLSALTAAVNNLMAAVMRAEHNLRT